MSLTDEVIRELRFAIARDFIATVTPNKHNLVADLILALAANGWSLDGVHAPVLLEDRGDRLTEVGLCDKLSDGVGAFPELNDLEEIDSDFVRYILCAELYRELYRADHQLVSDEKLNQVKDALDLRYQALYQEALPSCLGALIAVFNFTQSESLPTTALTLMASVADVAVNGLLAVRGYFNPGDVAGDVVQVGIDLLGSLELGLAQVAEAGDPGAGVTVWFAAGGVTDFFKKRIAGPDRDELPIDPVPHVLIDEVAGVGLA